MTGRGGDETPADADRQRPLLSDGGLQAADGFAPIEYDIRWSYTVHTREGSHTFELRSNYTEYDDPDVGSFVYDLFWRTPFPDDRAEWHHNYTPLPRWIKAHILRLVKDWNHQELQEHLTENPIKAQNLGFNDDQEVLNVPQPPGYTQLRDIWAETFTDRVRAACEIVAEELVQLARAHGLPAPDDVFVPDEDVEADDADEDDPTVRELTTEKSVDVWEHAKPFVTKYWYLKRHHNWQVPENTFFDAQSQMAAGEDIFPETGLGNLRIDGDHDRVHYPSTHRKELKEFDLGEIREMHHKVAKELVQRARKDNELVGKVSVAIDITKGHPWTGQIDRNADGENIEPWILGYMNDNDTRPQYYFQWATIQVVGFDIPLVLDAVPVHRGLTRGTIVDELLDNALDIIDDIEMLYMDSGFASKAVKEACGDHGIYYLNSGVLDEDNDSTPADMRAAGDTVRLEEQETLDPDRPSEKTIYLPSYYTRSEGDDEDEEPETTQTELGTEQEQEQEEEDEDDAAETSQVRREMLDELGLEEEDVDDVRPMQGLLDDIHEQEGTDADEPDEDDDADVDDDGDDDDERKRAIVKFETNHPAITAEDGDGGRITGVDKIHLLARHVRRYKNRWGIENGYKKIKRFLSRSGSSDPTLRFFNFTFACVLYNCWRVVDLLVKLEVEDDPAYTPLVTAGRFRKIAEQMFGLEKPPPAEWPI